MKRITLMEGIGVALCFAMATIPLSIFFTLFFPTLKMRGTFIAMVMAYLLYLVTRRVARQGRVITFIASGACCTALVLFSPSIAALMAGASLLIWIVRSLLLHRRPLPALLDGAVSLCACGFASGAYYSGSSIILVVWSFFLVQALFVICSRQSECVAESSKSVDEFSRAHLAAEEAFAALVNR